MLHDNMGDSQPIQNIKVENKLFQFVYVSHFNAKDLLDPVARVWIHYLNITKEYSWLVFIFYE